MERLGPVDTVPEGKGVVFESSRGPLLVVRSRGEFHAYEDRCPHMGISLRWPPADFLSPDGQYLICANHNAAFRIDNGVCIFGPCKGERLWTCPVSVTDGALWIEP